MEGNRRRHKRYDTQVQIYFHVAYDLKTKVKFRIVKDIAEGNTSKKYSAISSNVSASGLCFSSDKILEEDEVLHLEVFLPGEKTPIKMGGEVIWSSEMPTRKKDVLYETGVKLLTVNGEDVEGSIYYDKRYEVQWSIVLETVLGNYRIASQKRKK